MVASDVYMREDRNEAAHIAAESAVRAANMGDVTASGSLTIVISPRNPVLCVGCSDAFVDDKHV
jgi:hypothetical protein